MFAQLIQNFIAGKLCYPADAKRLPVTNPATGEVTGEVALSSSAEVDQAVQAAKQAAADEPLFRLIHGLPGSGKSQILKWLRSYFNEVWLWGEGTHYQFLAPSNSMADDIGGATLHS